LGEEGKEEKGTGHASRRDRSYSTIIKNENRPKLDYPDCKSAHNKPKWGSSTLEEKRELSHFWVKEHM